LRAVQLDVLALSGSPIGSARSVPNAWIGGALASSRGSGEVLVRCRPFRWVAVRAFI
jgi:hypothetical protein